jgi:signal transduction histidine kinase
MAKTINSVSSEIAAPSGDILTLLNDIDAGSIAVHNFDTALEKVAGIVAGYLAASHTYIMLKDKDGNLESKAHFHSQQHDEPITTISDAVTSKVIEEAAGILVTDAMNNEVYSGDPSFQRFNIGTVICSAIKTSESTFGLIYADSTESRKWDESILNTLEFIAGHLALAVNVVHSYEQNKRLLAAGQATLNLSHSVKNILQMVGGASEVIDFGLKSNQIHRVKKSWDILKPNLERLRKFTLDMLDYSKERRLELGPCDFNRVIQGAIEPLKSQLKQKKSELHISVDRKIPTIELDEERIHEMALNLVLNAIDIVDQDTGVVNVKTKYHTTSGEVELSVSDNGPGMTQEIQEKIFTPFESAKNKFGTGLGMPIAKQVIDQHKGRIEIESKEGQGATFKIFLPAKIIK